jgi:hypothetical protein
MADGVGVPARRLTPSGGHRALAVHRIARPSKAQRLAVVVPLHHLRRVYADRGYDHHVYRDNEAWLEITPVMARPSTSYGFGR